MTTPNRTLLTAAAVLAVLLAGPAAGTSPPASDPSGARKAVEVIVAEALTVLRNAALSEAQKRQGIENLADRSFDFDRISKLVLARNWKKLSAEQRGDFIAEFRRHLSITYGRRLNRFTDEDVVVGDDQDHPNGDITIKTTIIGGQADGVALDYRMRTRDGNWYAIDLIIEGVSMISNFRSQVQEIVSTKGADGLIDALREKNQREEMQEPG